MPNSAVRRNRIVQTPVDCGHDVGVMQDSDSQWEPVFHVGRLILGRKENLVRPRGAVGIAISIGSLVHIGGHERVVVTNYVAEILDIAATYEQCAYIVESVLHPRMTGVVKRIGHFVTGGVNRRGAVLAH